jgi:hypothetical protein
MKPVDKKDMPKLIALIGLTVCSLGYGIFTLVGSMATAAPPPAKKDDNAATAANGAAPGAVAAADDPMMIELKRLEGISEPVLVRDPFTSLSGVAPSPAPSTTSAPPAPLPGVAPVANPEEARRDLAVANANARAIHLGELLGINVRPKRGAGEDLMGSSPAAPGPVAPLPIPPPQPPSISVSGVMIPESGQGESIAIVRVNDKSRWLSVGDSLGNGFAVRSIRRTDRGSELEIVDSNNKSRKFTYKVN